MSDKKFFKTAIVYEVLHEESNIDRMNLAEIERECIHGDFSGRSIGIDTQQISLEELHAKCDEHGTDIEFFIPKPESYDLF